MVKKEILKWAKALNWRPTKMTEETIKKLLDAFSYSFTDEEACIYANISPKTLYNYWEKFPEFLQQKEILKKKPNLKAKMNKVKAVNEGNLQESWWWLERKSKDEFSTKTVWENTNTTTNLNLEVEDSKELKKLLNDNGLI